MITAIAAESIQDAIEAYEAAKVVADRIDDDRSMTLYPNDMERRALLDAFTDSEADLAELIAEAAGPDSLSAHYITPEKVYSAVILPDYEDEPPRLAVTLTTRVMDLRG
jgi:hypothetical protein